MSHASFEEGDVSWACDATGKTPQFYPQFADINLSNLEGCTSFYITAKLSSSGSQDNSWQHTQLFRTELGCGEAPFYLELNF